MAVEKKILIVDDESGIRDILEMVVSSYFFEPVVLAASGHDAIKILEKDQDFGIILCDFEMSDGDGCEVFNYVKNHVSQIPFCLVSSHEPAECEGMDDFDKVNTFNSYIKKPFRPEDIVQTISYSLGESENKSNYYSVDAQKFIRLNSNCPLTVYIKLSESKFVRITDEEMSSDFYPSIERYINKGVENFYLDLRSFEKFLAVALDNIFVDLDNENEEIVQELYFESLDDVSTFIRGLGVTPILAKAVEKTVSVTTDLLAKHKDLGELLELLNQKSGHIKNHAYLTSFVTCALASSLGWKTQDILNKFVTASLFQNIMLEDDEQAKILSLETGEFENLDRKDQELVRDHPISGAGKLCGDIPFLEEASKLIRNHHELPDGSGFPRGLGANQVQLIEALFILSSNFSHIALSCPKEDLIVKVRDMKEIFNIGNYKKCYQALIDTFKNLT